MRKNNFSKIVLILVIAFFGVNFYLIKILNEKRTEIAEEKIEIFNMSLRSSITDPLWKYDMDYLGELSNYFVERPEINQISIHNDRYELLQTYIASKIVSKNYKSYQVPIIKLGSTIGYINVEYSEHFLTTANSEFLRLFYAIQFILILIFLLLILFYTLNIEIASNHISEAIEHLINNNTNYHLNLKKYVGFKNIETEFVKLRNWFIEIRMSNKRNLEEFTLTKEELEAAYNQMISINGVLETTLSDLEISESKYKNIFKYSPFGIALYNIDGNNIIESNHELLDIFSATSESSLDDFFKIENIPFIIKSLYHSNGINEEELYLHSIEKIVSISVIPFKDKDKYIQVFFKDITEIKNLQVKLQNYAKDLEREVTLQTKGLKEANKKIQNQQKQLVEDAYNKGLVEVTSGIIHNIGNIVNVISLNLDELKYAFESNEKVLPNFLEKILLTELKKLDNLDIRLEKAVKIIPDLLHIYEEFDQETNNKVEYLHRKVEHLKEIVQLQQNFVGSLGTEDYNSINQIIDEVLDIYESSLSKRSILVEKDYCEDSSLLCDKAQIIQLFSNFIKNSYEAIEEMGREEGKINIKTFIKNSYLTIEITDNGLGLKPESFGQIFDFGYSTKKHTGIGTGFGLHSCKEIVEKYGGTIEYKSEYQVYTKFIINLPIGRKA